MGTESNGPSSPCSQGVTGLCSLERHGVGLPASPGFPGPWRLSLACGHVRLLSTSQTSPCFSCSWALVSRYVKAFRPVWVTWDPLYISSLNLFASANTSTWGFANASTLGSENASTWGSANTSTWGLTNTSTWEHSRVPGLGPCISGAHYLSYPFC